MARYETTATDPADWKPVTLPGKIPLKNVRLTSGVFRQIFQRNIQYLKDSLKKPQWVDAKDPDRIWVDMLVASNEGRMLGGMGNTLRYAEEPAFREAIAGILDAVERRQFANWNGYLMPYESRNYRLSTDTWPAIMRDEEKNYDRAMFTKGMLAAGAAGFGEAYDMLRHFYDWFNGAEEYLPIMLLGSMAIQGSIAGPLVYHSPVGVPDDIQTNQKYYDLDWWLEYLAAGYPEAVYRFPLNRPHNYLLTSVCALFEEYTATGDEKYINACLGAWRIYHDYFQIPGGGISICEHFECKPWSHKLTNLPNNIYETCGSVFWVDLNHRFLQLWPDKELYAAEMEKSLYNIVFASQGPDGCIRYFNHMNQGKDRPGRYNTCCEIQATMLFGQLPQYIYMLRQDGVTVNLFAASSVDFCVEERPYALQMETAFPYEETVTMKVSAPQGGRMALRIRIPSWLQANAVIRVNGRDAAEGQPGSYVLLDREWTQGDTVSLLHIGRFDEQKNHAGLLQAFAKLLKTHPNCCLNLLGDGHLRTEMENYARELGIGHAVHFLGNQADVHPYLHDADIFLLPSKYEGMPMTIIEAMGTGLPIVASRVGGVPDMLRDGESGLLMDCDPGEVCAACERLIDSEDLRRTLGQNALADSARFSAETMAKRYCEEYERLTAKK